MWEFALATDAFRVNSKRLLDRRSLRQSSLWLGARLSVQRPEIRKLTCRDPPLCVLGFPLCNASQQVRERERYDDRQKDGDILEWPDAARRDQVAGAMLAFSRNRLSGSYCFLIAARRS
jgi:hypothetical protein